MHPPGDPGEPSARGRPALFALLSISVLLTGAATASGAPVSWHSAGAPVTAQAAPHVRNPGARVHDPDVVRSVRAAEAKRAVAAAKPRRPKVRHAAPFVPSGTGMWIHEWPKTMHGNARAIVRRAAAYGITTIYLRTGTKKGGFDGAPQLRALLIATRGTNIRVVPWDFPLLNNPRGDAYRLAKAARYRVRGAHMPTIRAIAPDIETGAEGTRIGAARVRTYFLWLRRYLPRSTSILSTVPWPSENRRGRFPYTTIARYSNALMPMAYWYNRNAYSVTNYSIRWLQRFHRPVLPVGQGFDSKLDASYLPHSNQWREIADFMHAARNNHVRAVSLWSWQTAAKPQWRALAAYRHVFHPPVPPKPKPRPRRPAVKAAPEHVWVQRLRPIPG